MEREARPRAHAVRGRLYTPIGAPTRGNSRISSLPLRGGTSGLICGKKRFPRFTLGDKAARAQGGADGLLRGESWPGRGRLGLRTRVHGGAPGCGLPDRIGPVRTCRGDKGNVANNDGDCKGGTASAAYSHFRGPVGQRPVIRARLRPSPAAGVRGRVEAVKGLQPHRAGLLGGWDAKRRLGGFLRNYQKPALRSIVRRIQWERGNQRRRPVRGRLHRSERATSRLRAPFSPWRGGG